ncbi:hypothetical protein EJB05_50289, partial [Eragrostis curvula]
VVLHVSLTKKGRTFLATRPHSVTVRRPLPPPLAQSARLPPHPTHQFVRASSTHPHSVATALRASGLTRRTAMQVAGGGGGGGDAADMRGRHRIQAELKKLEQEARFLEEELEELEKTDKVSSALQQFLVTIESKADPLLPVTTGPSNQSWDRWFEGPQDLRRCKCWFL